MMNPDTPYELNPENRVWSRRDGARIAYSDGSETESRLLEIVRSTKDRGVMSDELPASITDWPTEYHFSRSRHCLLRPLEIKSGDRVLELGCGCGALTRYLGECGAQVDAVEGSYNRASIAAARCRDLPHVNVYADDLTCFASDTPYDWVLLIGVLEYAPVYSSASDPVGQYLARAVSFMAPSGRLVVAIENKLGLKYFNGCSEDHVGRSYYGIQRLYIDGQAVTFGKQELSSRLAGAGLPHMRFYYPFPDYKLPVTILTDAGLNSPALHAPALLPWEPSRDYMVQASHAFSEPLAWRELHANGLIGAMANSFLVTAARQPLPDPDQKRPLAWCFDVQCASDCATRTLYTASAAGAEAYRARLNSDAAEEVTLNLGGFLLKRSLGLRKAPESDSMAAGFMRACIRHGTPSVGMEMLTDWFRYLCKQASGNHPAWGNTALPLRKIGVDGAYFDCTPFRMDAAGNFEDAAWRVEGSVPLGWILTRSIRALLDLLPLTVAEKSPVVILNHILTLFQFDKIPVEIKAVDVANWLLLEQEFQRWDA